MRKFKFHLSAVITEQMLRDLIGRAILQRNTGATLDDFQMHSPISNLSITAEITLPTEAEPNMFEAFLKDAIMRAEAPIVTTTFLLVDSIMADLQAKADKKVPLAMWEDEKSVADRLEVMKTKKANGDL